MISDEVSPDDNVFVRKNKHTLAAKRAELDKLQKKIAADHEGDEEFSDAIAALVNEANTYGVSPARLNFLARNKSIRLRTTVAHNRSTPPSSLRLLANDPVEAVRKAAVSNNKLPADSLIALLVDESEKVRTRANWRTMSAEETEVAIMLHDGDADEHLAMNPNLDPAYLHLLSFSPDFVTLFNVANNPSTEIPTFTHLWEKMGMKVSILQNPSFDILRLPSAWPFAEQSVSAPAIFAEWGFTGAILKSPNDLMTVIGIAAWNGFTAEQSKEFGLPNMTIAELRKYVAPDFIE
jgi:hypothetical protein